MCVRIYVDIETVPPDEREKESLKVDVLRRLLRDFKPVADQTKAVEIDITDKTVSCTEECEEKCSEEMFRKLALHAEYGRILCIGIIIEKDNVVTRRGVFGFDVKSGKLHLDEKKTIRGFWKILQTEFNPRRDLIIGHNLLDFDLPYIYKRSRINGIKPSVQLSFARYRNAPIFDTMREWAMWNLRESSVSLSLLAELLDVGIKKSDGMDGGRVYDELLAGNHERISEYCLQDVEVARAVYHRMILTDIDEVI